MDDIILLEKIEEYSALIAYHKQKLANYILLYDGLNSLILGQYANEMLFNQFEGFRVYNSKQPLLLN